MCSRPMSRLWCGTRSVTGLSLSYQALAEEVTADRVLDEVLAAIAPPQIDLGNAANHQQPTNTTQPHDTTP